jgi:hypothetical protein
MIRSRCSFVATAALLGLGWAGLGCTVILAPKDDVQRCNTADDCDETGDPRYVSECRFDEANLDEDSLDFDKVCVAAFKIQTCDPNVVGGELQAEFERLNTPFRYACDDTIVQKGCPPPPGSTCAPLAENYLGFCDDEENPSSPAYSGVVFPAQDLVDGFCQSFFCDSDWVCDENFECVKCDPDPEVPPGEGGCGTLYIGGEPSCAYPSDPSCGDGNTSADDPRFECPAA